MRKKSSKSIKSKMAKSAAPRPKRSSQVLATSAMLYEMEGRVNSRMDSGFERMNAKFEGLRSEFQVMRGDITELKSDVVELKSDVAELKSDVVALKTDVAEIKVGLHEVKSELFGVKSELHRVALLVEEQNARNKYVMDGYAQIYELLSKMN